MLQIRSTQMETFSEAALRGFETEMVNHLSTFSPPLAKALGEEQLRKTIQFGMDRAADYGFTFRGPVQFYLELMFLFGSHFDTDPQYPWIGEILTGDQQEPQMQRADQLFEATAAYRKKVCGPKDAYTIKGLKQISILAGQQPQNLQISSMPLILQQLKPLHPQKVHYVGEENLEALVHEALSKAEEYQLNTEHSIALLIVLMFFLGHGCWDDPLYPWIARTLTNEKISDPDGRARRLEKRASTWLDHVLDYFDKEMQS